MADDQAPGQQKRTLVPPPAEMGIVTSERIRHAIAHTARIQRVLTDNPEHAGRAAFEQQIQHYKTFLGGTPDETLAAVAKDLESVHDMNPDAISAAVTVLGG